MPFWNICIALFSISLSFFLRFPVILLWVCILRLLYCICRACLPFIVYTHCLRLACLLYTFRNSTTFELRSPYLVLLLALAEISPAFLLVYACLILFNCLAHYRRNLKIVLEYSELLQCLLSVISDSSIITHKRTWCASVLATCQASRCPSPSVATCKVMLGFSFISFPPTLFLL